MTKINLSAKIFVRSAFVALALVSSTASFGQSDPGWYIGGEGFFSHIQDSTDNLAQPTFTQGTNPQLCTVGANPLPAPLNSNFLPSPIPLCLFGTLSPGTPSRSGTLNTPIKFKYSSGYTAGLNMGYAYASGLRPELNLSYSRNNIDTITYPQGTDSNPDGSVNSLRLMLNGWYDFKINEDLKPYVGLGLGGQRTKLDLRSTYTTTAFAYQLGAGINWWITNKTTLSLDYRFVDSRPEHDLDNGVTLSSKLQANQIGLGLKYYFKGEPPKPIEDADGDGVPDNLDKCPNTPKGVSVDAHGCPLDSDGDGVPDYKDKCPNTPPGVTVNADGCPLDSDGDGVPDYLDKCPGTPAGVPVNADGCPNKDSDGDGVPDYKDKCPNTPLGQKVGPDGCPLDSDGDGVPDDVDECPNTPAGAKVLPNGCALKGDCRRPKPGEPVDENGCALSKSFVLRGVKFEFDSDRLLPQSKMILNDVAETMKSYPEVGVEVSGHTDYIGTDAYNLGLSERRANAVKVYLEGRGIPGKRMSPVGYGKTVPIDSNETESGRENNRRVEFKVNE